METLKPLTEIMTPDERSTYMVLVNNDGSIKPWTLELVHAEVSGITLNDCVPDDVRSHFSQAQNLAVYAWFNYQFHVTTQFMSMVSIEYALKVKLKRKSNFKHLIEIAIKQNLISDEGFSHIGPQARKTSYVNTLTTVLPDLRNEHAHGTSMLHNGSLTSLRIAADFINQLFTHIPVMRE